MDEKEKQDMKQDEAKTTGTGAEKIIDEETMKVIKMLRRRQIEPRLMTFEIDTHTLPTPDFIVDTARGLAALNRDLIAQNKALTERNRELTERANVMEDSLSFARKENIELKAKLYDLEHR